MTVLLSYPYQLVFLALCKLQYHYEIQKDSHFLEVKGSGMLEYVRKHNNVDFIKKELAKVYL